MTQSLQTHKPLDIVKIAFYAMHMHYTSITSIPFLSVMFNMSRWVNDKGSARVLQGFWKAVQGF